MKKIEHRKIVLYKGEDHSFAVCAYGESPYLDECLRSLVMQTVKSHIFIITSTPNPHIFSSAEKYGIPLYVNNGEKGLAGDWNFAYDHAETSLVTLAHQDDRYYKNYTEDILTALNACCRHPLLVFTDYNERRENRTVVSNHLLKVKRFMLLPMRFHCFWRSRFIRRCILSFGNPICCPSVTFVKNHLLGFSFRNNMKSNIDWQAWEELSRCRGEFAYVSRPCMEHRIHPNSTTSGILEANERKKEDIRVLRRFWPEWAVKLIEYFYQKAEKFNEL